MVGNYLKKMEAITVVKPGKDYNELYNINDFINNCFSSFYKLGDKWMNYQGFLIGLFIMAISIIYWDLSRWEDKDPVSVCHNAPIKMYHERPMCTECKLFCEVLKWVLNGRLKCLTTSKGLRCPNKQKILA